MADDDPLFSIASTRPVARPTGRTLDDLIRAFENDPGRAGQSTKTGIEYSMVFRAMREVIGGDKDVEEITREDCRKLRDLFIALPSNATKKFPKDTLRQAVEQAAGMALPRLATKTVNNYIVKVASLLNWALKEEFIDRNPARGLSHQGCEAQGKPPWLPGGIDRKWHAREGVGYDNRRVGTTVGH